MSLAPLIFTEVFGCGQMAGPVVSSFLAHHDMEITVFGSPSDRYLVPRDSRVKAVAPTRADTGATWRAVASAYKQGHHGTALLWSHILRHNRGRVIVHLDSDIILLGDVLTPLLAALDDGSALAGPRRPQQYNDNNRDDVRGRVDTLHTYCIGIDSRSLPRWPRWLLKRHIEGRRTSWRRPLDFFDPVTAGVLRRGKKVTYLDSPHAGDSAKTDRESPWLANIMSLPSAAATGCALFNMGELNPADPYGKVALRSWSWFDYHLLGLETNLPRDSMPELEMKVGRLDRSKWVV